MINQFRHGDDIIEAKVNPGSAGLEVTVGDDQFRVREISPGKYEILHNGAKKTICCVLREAQAFVDVDGILLDLTIPSDDGEFSSGGGGHTIEKDKIYAPMPGKIVKLLVKEGDSVTQKQPMVIVEAMKMENQVNSPSNGVVKKINFQDGEQVGTETPIIELDITA